MYNEHLVTPEMIRHAEALVAEAHANGGLAPVDLDRFWADQEIAGADPFGADIPQVSMGVRLTNECVYGELGVEEDYWRYDNDPEWHVELNKAYNDKAERIVGRRLLRETVPDPALKYPPHKQLHDVFEAKNEWHDRSWWLRQSADSEDELKALLGRVEGRLGNLREFLLPDNWADEKARLTARGVAPPIYRHQRGPITFAASVFGPENLIFLLHDNPALAARFRDAILAAMLDIAAVLDAEAGFTPQTAPHGFSFADDNCCLMTPDMYELFGYPILKAMFETYSPDAGDGRYQHSDSAMGHLLPIIGSLDMTGVNFGPTLTVGEIREHCPRAVIDGQLAPFTLSRNEEVNIVTEFLRDFAQAREARGLDFSPAGSINNGSRLTGMRLLMAAAQRYGRYDG